MIVFAIISLPESYQPPTLNIDKLRHAAAYAFFGALAARAVYGVTGRGASFSFVAAFLAIFALGVGTESLQAIVPGRSADVVDLGADLAGGVMGAALFLWAFAGQREIAPS